MTTDITTLQAEKLALEIENQRLREVIQDVKIYAAKTVSGSDLGRFPSALTTVHTMLFDSLQAPAPDPSLLLVAVRAALRISGTRKYASEAMSHSPGCLCCDCELWKSVEALPPDVREMLGGVE